MARPRRSSAKPPGDHAAPIVRLLFRMMDEQGIGITEMVERTGINRASFSFWRNRSSPNFINIEACFNVLGYTLQPQPMKEPTE